MYLFIITLVSLYVSFFTEGGPASGYSTLLFANIALMTISTYKKIKAYLRGDTV